MKHGATSQINQCIVVLWRWRPSSVLGQGLSYRPTTAVDCKSSPPLSYSHEWYPGGLISRTRIVFGIHKHHYWKFHGLRHISVRRWHKGIQGSGDSQSLQQDIDSSYSWTQDSLLRFHLLQSCLFRRPTPHTEKLLTFLSIYRGTVLPQDEHLELFAFLSIYRELLFNSGWPFAYI